MPGAKMNHRNLILLIALSAALTGCVNADDTPKGASESSAYSEDSSGSSDSETVNGSIRVKSGEKRDDVSTVNGSIRIDDNASVASAHTVNGSITLGAYSSAASLHSVNGSITVGAGGTVSDNVSAVNGSLTLREAADVHSSLDNVNGRIQLQAAHVGGGIKTVSGDIDIGGDSRGGGGVLLQKAS